MTVSVGFVEALAVFLAASLLRRSCRRCCEGDFFLMLGNDFDQGQESACCQDDQAWLTAEAEDFHLRMTALALKILLASSDWQIARNFQGLLLD